MSGRGREQGDDAGNGADSGRAGGSGSAAPRGRPVLRSILGIGLQRWLRFGLGVAVFMLANTLYLLANRLADGVGLDFFAVGENSLPKLFQTMVLTHTGVGLVLAAVMFGFLAAHLPTVWKRKHRASILTGIGMGLVGGVLVLTGLFILTAAASRENSWAWWAHVGSALLIVSAYAGHRLVSYARPPRVRARRFALATGAVVLVLVAGHSLTHRGLQLTPEAEAALAQGAQRGAGGPGPGCVPLRRGRLRAAGTGPSDEPVLPGGHHDEHRYLAALTHHHPHGSGRSRGAGGPGARGARPLRGRAARVRNGRADWRHPVRALPPRW